MSLENSKTYEAEKRQEQLQEQAKARTNGVSPHQAPQRERVSLSGLPASLHPNKRWARKWTEHLSPDRNMGVPQLMMILEPNVVWEHTSGYSARLGKTVESTIGSNQFLEGWHKGGRLARGVYEGSYWDLLADCEDLSSSLAKITRAPRPLDDPTLVMPPQPELPSYELYRPALAPVPKAPILPQLHVPPFRPPSLLAELPFEAPTLLPVPPAPSPVADEPLPVFVPPKPEPIPAYQRPVFRAPKLPGPDPPTRTAPAEPQHGHDWTGLRPFTVPEPAYQPPELLDVPDFLHPPLNLPRPPVPMELFQDSRISLGDLPQLTARNSAVTREVSGMSGPAEEASETSEAEAEEAGKEAGAEEAELLAGEASEASLTAPTTPRREPSRPSSGALGADEEHADEESAVSDPDVGAADEEQGGSVAGSRPGSGQLGTGGPLEGVQEEPEAEEQAEGEGGETQSQAEEEEAAAGTPLASGHASMAGSRPGSSPAAAVRARTPGSRPVSVASAPASPPPALTAVRSASALGSPVPVRTSPMRSATFAAPDRRSLAGSADAHEDLHAAAGQSVRAPSESAASTAPQTPDTRHAQVPRPGSGQPQHEWTSLADRMWKPRPALKDHGLEELDVYDIPIKIPMLPREPLMGEVNGPEPQPEDFPPETLEPIPVFVPPTELHPLPAKLEYPEANLPVWVPPCEPRPIGFLRGVAPVLIVDVSGTMNPRMNGKFRDLKSCLCELLGPEGELATAAGAFDVIAFCNGAWSWSSTYASKQDLLMSSRAMHSGRQAGRLPSKPLGAGEKQGQSPLTLQPTEPDMLSDARNWISTWPSAVGHTTLLAAFQKAEEHWMSDCWYVFSDGLANDQALCVKYLEDRRKRGMSVPVIHSIGFFPECAPENYEGRRNLQTLSTLTGGSFQTYDRATQRIYSDSRFVAYDVAAESPAMRAEREWAEACLRSERRRNMSEGIVERLEVTLERVKAMHHEARIRAKEQQYKAVCAQLRREHRAQVAQVERLNAELIAAQKALHDDLVEEIQQRNQERLLAAREAYEAAHDAWIKVYEQAMAKWNVIKGEVEDTKVRALEGQKLAAQQRLTAQSIANHRLQSFTNNALKAAAAEKAQALAAQTKDVLARGKGRAPPPPPRQQLLSGDGDAAGSETGSSRRLRGTGTVSRRAAPSGGGADKAGAVAASRKAAPGASPKLRRAQTQVQGRVASRLSPSRAASPPTGVKGGTTAAEGGRMVKEELVAAQGTDEGGLEEAVEEGVEEGVEGVEEGEEEGVDGGELVGQGGELDVVEEGEAADEEVGEEMEEMEELVGEGGEGGSTLSLAGEGETEQALTGVQAQGSEAEGQLPGGSRAGTPAQGSRVGTPAHGSRAGTPPQGSRVGTPTGGSRAGTPSRGSRVGTPAGGSRVGTPRAAMPSSRVGTPKKAVQGAAQEEGLGLFEGEGEAEMEGEGEGEQVGGADGALIEGGDEDAVGVEAEGLIGEGGSQPQAGEGPAEVQAGAGQGETGEGQGEAGRVTDGGGRLSQEGSAARPPSVPSGKGSKQSSKQGSRQGSRQGTPGLSGRASLLVPTRSAPGTPIEDWGSLPEDPVEREKLRRTILVQSKNALTRYADRVVRTYAAGFVKDVIHNAAIHTIANAAIVEAAREAHEAEVLRVKEENDRIAELHALEVDDRFVKEQEDEKAMAQWKAQQEMAMKEYEVQLKAAKRVHDEQTARAEQDWQTAKQQIEARNLEALLLAQEAYEELVASVNEDRIRRRAELNEYLVLKKSIDAQNSERLAAAQEAHAQQVEEARKANAAKVAQAQAEYQIVSARLHAEHEEAKRQAIAEFEQLRQELLKRNEVKTEEARAKYRKALDDMQAAHVRAREQARIDHAAQVEAVRRANAEIAPRVMQAKLAEEELRRVRVFVEHIKACANKVVMGMNLLPNTPNYDRVVEMQALMEALAKAYPDDAPQEYPWPDAERRAEAGTGWVAPPVPRTVEYRDPLTEVLKAARVKALAQAAAAAGAEDALLGGGGYGSAVRMLPPIGLPDATAGRPRAAGGAGAGTGAAGGIIRRLSSTGATVGTVLPAPAAAPPLGSTSRSDASDKYARPTHAASRMRSSGAPGAPDTSRSSDGRSAASAGPHRSHSTSNLLKASLPEFPWDREPRPVLGMGNRPLSAQDDGQAWGGHGAYSEPASPARHVLAPLLGGRGGGAAALMPQRMARMFQALQMQALAQSGIAIAPTPLPVLVPRPDPAYPVPSPGPSPLAGLSLELPRLHYTELDALSSNLYPQQPPMQQQQQVGRSRLSQDGMAMPYLGGEHTQWQPSARSPPPHF